MKETKIKTSFLKTLLALVLMMLVAMLFAPQANAQMPRYVDVPLKTFTTVGGAATTFTNLTIDARMQNSVGLQWDQKSNLTNISTLTLAYQLSNTKLKWGPIQTITIASSGTTDYTTPTNIPTWGFGWVNLVYLTNANAGTVYTTNSLQYSQKQMAP